MGNDKAEKGEAREPYSDEDKLILRDHLAIDRTVLANERTLLSYVRTALAFFIAGVGVLHFFPDPMAQLLGWTMVPAGIVTLIIGAYRYNKMRHAANSMHDKDPLKH